MKSQKGKLGLLTLCLVTFVGCGGSLPEVPWEGEGTRHGCEGEFHWSLTCNEKYWEDLGFPDQCVLEPTVEWTDVLGLRTVQKCFDPVSAADPAYYSAYEAHCVDACEQVFEYLWKSEFKMLYTGYYPGGSEGVPGGCDITGWHNLLTDCFENPNDITMGYSDFVQYVTNANSSSTTFNVLLELEVDSSTVTYDIPLDYDHGKIGYFESCEGDSCTLDIVHFNHALEDFVYPDAYGGVDVTFGNIDLVQSSVIQGEYDKDTGGLIIPPGSMKVFFKFNAEWTYDGDDFWDKGGLTVSNENEITAIFQPDLDFFQIAATLTGSSEGASAEVDFSMEGGYFYLPPVASIGGPSEPVECDGNYAAHVNLLGSVSTDPTPGGVIIRHMWFIEKDGEFNEAGAVADNVLLFDMGTHFVGLVVENDRNVYANTGTEITVQDTTPPHLVIETPHAETCVPAPSWVFLDHVAFSVSDICTDDSTIEVSGEITKINGLRLLTPVSVSTDSADPDYLMAYLPMGTHEITWEATDEFDNSATLVQRFDVDYVSDVQCCEIEHVLWT